MTNEGIPNGEKGDSDANKAKNYPYWCKSTEKFLPLDGTVKSFAPILLIVELLFTNVLMLSIIIAIFR